MVSSLAVHGAVHVAQYKDHAWLVASYYGVDAGGQAVDVGVGAVIAHEVHAELVEAQVGDGDAARHIFQVDVLGAHLLKLPAAVVEIAGLAGVDVVVVARGGHHGYAPCVLPRGP